MTSLKLTFQDIANSIRRKSGSPRLIKPIDFALKIDDLQISATVINADTWTRPTDWPRCDLIDTKDTDQVIFLVDMEDRVKPFYAFRLSLKKTSDKYWLFDELRVNGDGSYEVISSERIPCNGSPSKTGWIEDNGNRYRVFRMKPEDADNLIINLYYTTSPVGDWDPDLSAIGVTIPSYQMTFIKEWILETPNAKTLINRSEANPSTMWPEHLISRRSIWNTYGFWQNYGLKQIDVLNPITLSSHTGLAFGKAQQCKILNISCDYDWQLSVDMNWYQMFLSNYRMVSADVSFLDNSKPAKHSSDAMFNACRDLLYIKGLNCLDTSEISTFNTMFSGCESMQTLDCGNFHYTNALNLNAMFSNMTKLVEVDFGHLEECENVLSVLSMFQGLASLYKLDLSRMITPNVTNFKACFANCADLRYIDISNFDFSNATNMSDIFLACACLQYVKWPTDISRGPRVSFKFDHKTIHHDSIVELLNILQDLTGQTVQVLTLGKDNINKLSDDEKAIATNKNWTLA